MQGQQRSFLIWEVIDKGKFSKRYVFSQGFEHTSTREVCSHQMWQARRMRQEYTLSQCTHVISHIVTSGDVIHQVVKKKTTLGRHSSTTPETWSTVVVMLRCNTAVFCNDVSLVVFVVSATAGQSSLQPRKITCRLEGRFRCKVKPHLQPSLSACTPRLAGFLSTKATKPNL